MARKRPASTKRFRERARRERQEEKTRRKAARQAARENPAATPSAGDTPETVAEETTDVHAEEKNVAGEAPPPAGEGRDQGEGDEQRDPGHDAAGRAATASNGGRTLTVTRDASELLSKILAREEAAGGVVVRFSLAEDGSFSLSLGSERPDDETFAHDGRTVLVMEPAVARRLENDTLDVEESPDGLGLTLTDRGADRQEPRPK